jgi:hypothetical protein
MGGGVQIAMKYLLNCKLFANELVYALLGTYERKTIKLHRTINEATRLQIALNHQ